MSMDHSKITFDDLLLSARQDFFARYSNYRSTIIHRVVSVGLLLGGAHILITLFHIGTGLAGVLSGFVVAGVAIIVAPAIALNRTYEIKDSEVVRGLPSIPRLNVKRHNAIPTCNRNELTRWQSTR